MKVSGYIGRQLGQQQGRGYLTFEVFDVSGGLIVTFSLVEVQSDCWDCLLLLLMILVILYEILIIASQNGSSRLVVSM